MNGSLLEQRPGVWGLCVYLGRSPEGRVLHALRTVHGTKSAAQRALRTFVTEVEASRTPDRKAPVAVLLERWLEHHGPGLAASTLREHRRTIRTSIDRPSARSASTGSPASSSTASTGPGPQAVSPPPRCAAATPSSPPPAGRPSSGGGSTGPPPTGPHRHPHAARLQQRVGLTDPTGRPRFRFHDLRHVSATVAIAAGVDIRSVAGRLGHADASTTLRVSAHAVAAADQAAAALGRALGA